MAASACWDTMALDDDLWRPPVNLDEAPVQEAREARCVRTRERRRRRPPAYEAVP